MDVTIKMADDPRWRPTPDGVELIGDVQSPVYRDYVQTPLIPGRGPYMEVTQLGEDVQGLPRPLITGLPDGLALTSSGLEVAEPQDGFSGATRFIPFEDQDLLRPGFFAGVNGAIWARLEVPGSVPDAVNSALIGVHDELSGEWMGLGVLGSGTTGAAVSWGLALQLNTGGAPDPLRILRAGVASGLREIGVQWAVTESASDLMRLKGVHYDPSSGSGAPAVLGGAAVQIDVDFDRWREFISSEHLKLGLIMHIPSIRAEAAPSPVHYVKRFRLNP